MSEVKQAEAEVNEATDLQPDNGLDPDNLQERRASLKKTIDHLTKIYEGGTEFQAIIIASRNVEASEKVREEHDIPEGQDAMMLDLVNSVLGEEEALVNLVINAINIGNTSAHDIFELAIAEYNVRERRRKRELFQMLGDPGEGLMRILGGGEDVFPFPEEGLEPMGEA